MNRLGLGSRLRWPQRPSRNRVRKTPWRRWSLGLLALWTGLMGLAWGWFGAMTAPMAGQVPHALAITPPHLTGQTLESPTLEARNTEFSDIWTTPLPIQPTPPQNYLPVADWAGRLMLPDQATAEASGTDWVWMEVLTSPDAAWIGQRVRLGWQDTPETQTFLTLVTRGIEFNAAALGSLAKGIVHPTRLNGWAKVGPLQSLAGTRSQDDMLVALPPVVLGQPDPEGHPVLLIDAMPTQIPERFYGLVQILGPVADGPRPDQCPGREVCPSDLVQVRHYNPASQAFDGPTETVHLPQVPAHPRTGVFQSTPQELAQSSAGEAGWYLYGAPDATGTLVVRSIVPRRLFQLQPQQLLVGQAQGLNHIRFGNWRNTPQRKGQISSVLVQAKANPEESTVNPTWAVGDRLLLLHLFGGIGGDLAEPRSVPGTVTGHFAFGLGEVVTDPFTQEPQLRLIYDQVYSHNAQGIVAGRTLWAEYSGNLKRGWLGTRPIGDALVLLPALSHTYTLGDLTFSPLTELERQLTVMMARYRTGDGTGASIVTPAQSCVQDSSQALYETIRVLRNQVSRSPLATEWLANHPNDPQTALFQDLVALSQRLQGQLVPLGMVRPDWRDNASVLTGIEEVTTVDTEAAGRFANQTTWLNNLLSWRTVIPRVAYDNMAAIFLQQGADLWFLGTYQVGGADPTLLPLAPTPLFGDFVVIPVAFSRLIESLAMPSGGEVLMALLGLGLFGLIQARLPAAVLPHPPPSFLAALIALFSPVLWQELLFRVLLLPHPSEGVRPLMVGLWAMVSLGLWWAYHALQQRRWTSDPLSLSSLGRPLVVGLLTTLLYLATGSLLIGVGFHWGTGWLSQGRLWRSTSSPS
ncbi:CPBP family glutamic-type intramembrane protease [Phormidium sp. FACHB-1136]|uniref:CPBP family glutamic-type intramembrane protease n=1 Tax=Phormidium sp. FACHB-1136 TaxID=2692848 RepID=UPI001681F295|nr:CPBP family glutamic-type intramembrane protease [Phormidium sp. FACHB-1136]MBD2427735.1 CPBP family intramembrane metalloprotease [Phormidium sp. FACHB-1136]